MAAAPLIHAIDCIRLAVSDLEAGLQFYRDRLGHELIWRTADAAGLRLPGTPAEIVLHLEPISPEIDFKVPAADEAAACWTAAGGSVIVPPFDISIGRAVVVEDPWGNRFVLLDDSKGTFITDDQGRVTGLAPRQS